MEKHFLFILTKAPHGSSSAKESTDAMMATCAFGQKVSILVLGDALHQFTKGQNTEDLNLKDTAAMLESLPLYGTEEIIVTAEDLNDYCLSPTDFVLPAKAISTNEVSEVISQSDVVLSY